MTIPVPVDPREVVLDWLRPILGAILPGADPPWTAGAKIKPGVTPVNFVLVKAIAGSQTSPISDQVTIAFQLWGANGLPSDHERTRAARIISAHARRDLGGRRASTVIDLPDPADNTRTISQITITALLTGVDQ